MVRTGLHSYKMSLTIIAILYSIAPTFDTITPYYVVCAVVAQVIRSKNTCNFIFSSKMKYIHLFISATYTMVETVKNGMNIIWGYLPAALFQVCFVFCLSYFVCVCVC